MLNIFRIRILAAGVGATVCFFGAAYGQKGASAATAASAEFKSLLVLKAALAKIPMEKQEQEPHKSFLKRNEKRIVYSDPSAEYYVRSELFWNLRNKYRTLPIAEDIAWAAAQNPLPGECEGDIICYLDLSTVTEGRYLAFYPQGKHGKEALGAIENLINSVMEIDAADDDSPTGPVDKAQLRKTTAQLRRQIAGVRPRDKSLALALIDELEAKYK